MAFAVYIKDLVTGTYVKRSIWFHSSRLVDCNRCTWRWRNDGFDAITVMDKDKEGEM